MPSYFDLAELTSSDTADKHQLANEPPSKARANLQRLIDQTLAPIREEVDQPVYVTSGYRSVRLNKLVDGVDNSRHTRGTAADIYTVGHTARELEVIIRRLAREGQIPEPVELIAYPDKGHVHVAVAD